MHRVTDLNFGERVRVVVGEAREADRLRFDVVVPIETPVCNFWHLPYHGRKDNLRIGPAIVRLEGCLPGEFDPGLEPLEELYDRLEMELPPADGLIRERGILVIAGAQRTPQDRMTLVRRVILPPISEFSIHPPDGQQSKPRPPAANLNQ